MRQRASAAEFLAADWREVNGIRSIAHRTNGWRRIYGKILSVIKPGDYLVKADYLDAPTYRIFHAKEGYVDGEEFSELGFQVQNYSYTAASRAKITVEGFDAGLRTGPPPEMVKAFQEAARLMSERAATNKAAVLSSGEAAALKVHQQQAEAGRAWAEFEMGKRYLEGRGVEADRAKALYWLYRAHYQTNAQATALLKEIGAEK